MAFFAEKWFSFQGQEKLRQRRIARRKSVLLFQGKKHSLNEVSLYRFRSSSVCMWLPALVLLL
jgi:hypothetical protein